MPTITSSSTIVRSDSILSSPVDSEIVMIDLQRGSYYGLDAVGADIWNRLAAPTRVAELCESLVREYDVDPATCEQDVLALLDDMAAQMLVREV